METSRIVSDSTGVTHGRLSTLKNKRSKQNCLGQLWSEHVNRVETNRIVSDGTGVIHGRLSTLR
jgi:ribosomal protein L13